MRRRRTMSHCTSTQLGFWLGAAVALSGASFDRSPLLTVALTDNTRQFSPAETRNRHVMQLTYLTRNINVMQLTRLTRNRDVTQLTGLTKTWLTRNENDMLLTCLTKNRIVIQLLIDLTRNRNVPPQLTNLNCGLFESILTLLSPLHQDSACSAFKRVKVGISFAAQSKAEAAMHEGQYSRKLASVIIIITIINCWAKLSTGCSHWMFYS